jgi:hypothetical protein
MAGAASPGPLHCSLAQLHVLALAEPWFFAGTPPLFPCAPSFSLPTANYEQVPLPHANLSDHSIQTPTSHHLHLHPVGLPGLQCHHLHALLIHRHANSVVLASCSLALQWCCGLLALKCPV